LLHLIGKGTTCNGTISVIELSKQQYYAEDDNYRHDVAYGNQSARAATGEPVYHYLHAIARNDAEIVAQVYSEWIPRPENIATIYPSKIDKATIWTNWHESGQNGMKVDKLAEILGLAHLLPLLG